MEVSGILDKLALKDNYEEGDYVVDGLLYCGKCHTKKQTRVHPLGEERIVVCTCQCKREAQEKEEAERKQRDEFEAIRRLRVTGFANSEMLGWTFSKDDGMDTKLSKAARRYVENWNKVYSDNIGLLLFGPVGTGKTFFAACIVNALIDKNIPCLMTNFARISMDMQSDFEGRRDYIDNIMKYKLLVIDDLAAERKTEYMDEVVQTVIDARYRTGKPLIVTTNLTKDELTNPSDMTKKRTYSRLFEMCHPIEVTGYDRRKVKLRNNYNDTNRLLGLDE